MRIFQSLSSTTIETETQAMSNVLVPGIGGIGELLYTIIMLCDSVPQSRDAARRLAQRCQYLYKALEQYKEMPFPERTVQYRADLFKCLQNVKDTMQKWSEKSWFRMFVNQSNFDRDINDCATRISDCLAIFITASHMELLARQEDRKGKVSMKLFWQRIFHRIKFGPAQWEMENHTVCIKSL